MTAVDTVVTTGPPAAIVLSAVIGAEGLEANGQDILMLTASVVDEDGNVVPTANNLITFSVSGPAAIIGIRPIYFLSLPEGLEMETQAATSPTKLPGVLLSMDLRV